MTLTPTPNTPVTPNRVGLRDGQISELTVIVPLKPGGAEKLRAFLASVKGRSPERISWALSMTCDS